MAASSPRTVSVRMPDEVTISSRSESVMRPVSVARETTVFRVNGDSGEVR